LLNTNFHRANAPNSGNSNNANPSYHPKLTKRRLIAQILHQYQDRGDAMRYLDVEGKIAWKASPRFLTKLADAKRDAQDELEEFP
jgi:hypothetical protein